MQEFCAGICRRNNITESLTTQGKLVGVPTEVFFSGIAETITSKADFDLLA